MTSPRGQPPLARPAAHVRRVEHRNLVLRLEEYGRVNGFGMANDTFIEAAVELGTEVLRSALDAAGLAPGAVDMIMYTSATGIALPSIDARVASRLGMRSDVRRIPMFGLACLGGVPAPPARSPSVTGSR